MSNKGLYGSPNPIGKEDTKQVAYGNFDKVFNLTASDMGKTIRVANANGYQIVLPDCRMLTGSRHIVITNMNTAALSIVDNAGGAVSAIAANTSVSFRCTDTSSSAGRWVVPSVSNGDTDPYWSNVSLLLNGDGANGSTTFTDLSLSPTTVTAYGNAQISTTTKKFGTGSIYFDGTGDKLVIPGNNRFAFEARNFTIEFWLNFVSLTSGGWGGGFLTTWHIGGANSESGWSIGSSGNGTSDISFGGMLTSSTSYGMPGIDLLPYANQWVHYAVVRNGGTLTQFLNGQARNTYSIGATPIYYPNSNLWVGMWGDGYEGPRCYVDDLRITNGSARYLANFTPPTQSLPTQ